MGSRARLRRDRRRGGGCSSRTECKRHPTPGGIVAERQTATRPCRPPRRGAPRRRATAERSPRRAPADERSDRDAGLPDPHAPDPPRRKLASHHQDDRLASAAESSGRSGSARAAMFCASSIAAAVTCVRQSARLTRRCVATCAGSPRRARSARRARAAARRSARSPCRSGTTAPIVDCALGAQAGEQHRHAGADVRALHPLADELRRAGDDRAVRVAEDDARAHRDELVGEEQPVLEHLLEDEHRPARLGRDRDARST